MKRRQFIKNATVGAGGLVAARMLGAAPRPRANRPNVLFIWTDQQTATALSCAGNPWVKTPAMDSLAARGVRFEQTYCTNPICVPSRTSWLSGRMPHETGVQFNTERAQVTVPALSRQMHEAGYATGYVGKWHIPRDVDDVAWHGLDYRRAVHGSRIDGVIGGACAEFLDTPRGGAPFFLVASFMNPHDICEWARQEAGMNSPLPNGDLPPPPAIADCPPLPANFAIPAGEPEVVRALAAAAPRIYPTQEWTGDAWRRYLWAYYRLVEQVDQQIGDLLAGLRARGLDENTLIIFASDHGDGAAAHRWNQKTLFYDEVVRVPMMVCPPGGLGQGRVDATSLVSFNLDFFPTVFDYAGLATPAGMAGRSLRPLVERRASAAGHAMIVSQSEPAPEYGVSSGVMGRMATDGRWKYVRYSHGRDAEQLFDRAVDPGELNDLTRDPRFAADLQHWRDRLASWMADSADHWPAPGKKASFLS